MGNSGQYCSKPWGMKSWLFFFFFLFPFTLYGLYTFHFLNAAFHFEIHESKLCKRSERVSSHPAGMSLYLRKCVRLWVYSLARVCVCESQTAPRNRHENIIQSTEKINGSVARGILLCGRMDYVSFSYSFSLLFFSVSDDFRWSTALISIIKWFKLRFRFTWEMDEKGKKLTWTA